MGTYGSGTYGGGIYGIGDENIVTATTTAGHIVITGHEAIVVTIPFVDPADIAAIRSPLPGITATRMPQVGITAARRPHHGVQARRLRIPED